MMYKPVKTDCYDLLIAKVSQLLKIDPGEIEFFWEKFVKNEDDMTDEAIRKLFLVLKLQWGRFMSGFRL